MIRLCNGDPSCIIMCDKTWLITLNQAFSPGWSETPAVQGRYAHVLVRTPMRQKTLSATALSVTEPCSRGRTRRGRARHGIGPDDRVFSNPTSEVYAGGVDSGVVPVPTGEHVPVMVADVTSPRIAYAISRLLGRAAFVHAAGAKAVGAVIGRFHNGYGPRMGADHVIPEMSLRTLCGEDPLRVWGADQYRAFCYVDDAAEAMLRLMDRSGPLARSCTLEMAASRPTSVTWRSWCCDWPASARPYERCRRLRDRSPGAAPTSASYAAGRRSSRRRRWTRACAVPSSGTGRFTDETQATRVGYP